MYRLRISTPIQRRLSNTRQPLQTSRPAFPHFHTVHPQARNLAVRHRIPLPYVVSELSTSPEESTRVPLLFWEARCWVIKKPLFDFNKEPVVTTAGSATMSDTEDQLGPLREIVPIGIPSTAQSGSGRDRSTRCVGLGPTRPARQPRTHGLEGSHSPYSGLLRITGRMFVNQWADWSRDTPAWFSYGIDISFLSSDAYFPPDAPPSSPLGPPLLPPPIRSETNLAKSIDEALSTQTEQELAIEYVSFHTTRVDSLFPTCTLSRSNRTLTPPRHVVPFEIHAYTALANLLHTALDLLLSLHIDALTVPAGDSSEKPSPSGPPSSSSSHKKKRASSASSRRWLSVLKQSRSGRKGLCPRWIQTRHSSSSSSNTSNTSSSSSNTSSSNTSSNNTSRSNNRNNRKRNSRSGEPLCRWGELHGFGLIGERQKQTLVWHSSRDPRALCKCNGYLGGNEYRISSNTACGRWRASGLATGSAVQVLGVAS